MCSWWLWSTQRYSTESHTGDGTCEVGTVVNFGALGCSSILVSETMGPIELDMATPVVVGCIPTEDVIVSGSGASEVGTCCDRRSSSLVSDNREGIVVSCGAFHSERDSSLSSKLIIARLIRSLIRSAFCTSSSTCSLGMKWISSSSSFNKMCSLSVNGCLTLLHLACLTKFQDAFELANKSDYWSMMNSTDSSFSGRSFFMLSGHSSHGVLG